MDIEEQVVLFQSGIMRWQRTEDSPTADVHRKW